MAEHAASVEDIGGQEVASQQGVGRHGQSHGVHGAGRLQLVDPDQDSGTTQQEDDVTRKNVNSTICHATYSVNTGPQKTEETTQPLKHVENQINTEHSINISFIVLLFYFVLPWFIVFEIFFDY